MIDLLEKALEKENIWGINLAGAQFKTPRLYEFYEKNTGVTQYWWTMWVKTAEKQSYLAVLKCSGVVRVYDKPTLDDKYNFHNAKKIA